MAHVIVGIHGLSNKPAEDELKAGWNAAIMEGLDKNCGIADQGFEFELVYWADRMYDQPATSVDEPYLPFPEKPFAWGDRGIDDALRQYGVRVGTERFIRFRPVRWLRNEVLKRRELKDLARYYDPNARVVRPLAEDWNARSVLMSLLSTRLLGCKGDTVMVIAHSMGSIVAYDVLRDLGHPQVQMAVSDFATIGSPLGFDLVRKNVYAERSYSELRLRAPTIVRQRWANYADPGDRVALNWKLSDRYGPNERSVRVQDFIVHNNYRGPDGKRNAHKSYGYLRTPELSAHIREFLSRC